MDRQKILPKWRGFNLPDMFSTKREGYFSEEDFKMMSDWGFNFVRLPLSYRIWSSIDNPYEISEEKIAPLDEAVYFGKKYGIHTNIAFHRIPGYCVCSTEDVGEKYNFWRDDEARRAAAFQWREIAKRYKNESNDSVSFNIINEPELEVCYKDYHDAHQACVDAIYEISPDRLIMLDGIHGYYPPLEAMRNFDKCGFSIHCYEPGIVTHQGVGEGHMDKVPWPHNRKYGAYGERTVRNIGELDGIIALWAAASEIFNVGVHCGEFGCFYKLPHKYACAYVEDYLAVMQKYNIGWAMWNLRGCFGIMDNGREDCEMIDFCGHKLDVKMLKILQKY